MLVKEIWRSKFTIAGEVVAQYPEAMSMMIDEARRDIEYEVRAKIRRSSIIVTTVPDVSRNLIVVEVEWHPDPEEGVQFKGGPADGTILSLRKDAGRAPLYFIVNALPTKPLFETAQSALPPIVASRTVTYSRVGIDPMSDRWVYRPEGEE